MTSQIAVAAVAALLKAHLGGKGIVLDLRVYSFKRCGQILLCAAKLCKKLRRTRQQLKAYPLAVGAGRSDGCRVNELFYSFAKPEAETRERTGLKLREKALQRTAGRETVCFCIAYKAQHGNIARKAAAYHVIHPRVLKDVHHSAAEYAPDKGTKAPLLKQALGKFAHPFERVGIGAVVVLHLVRQEDAQTCRPVASVKAGAKKIRSAAENDLPVLGAVFKRGIELHGGNEPVIIEQKAEVSAEYALDGFRAQKLLIALKRGGVHQGTTLSMSSVS